MVTATTCSCCSTLASGPLTYLGCSPISSDVSAMAVPVPCADVPSIWLLCFVLQVVENVLAECGQDIDAAIRRLNQLKLSTEQGGQQAAAQPDTAAAPENPQQAHVQQAAAAVPSGPQTAEQWIDALVQEMAAAKDMEDARSRAGKLLQAFEQFVTARNKAEVSTCKKCRTAAVGGRVRIEYVKCLTGLCLHGRALAWSTGMVVLCIASNAYTQYACAAQYTET